MSTKTPSCRPQFAEITDGGGLAAASASNLTGFRSRGVKLKAIKAVVCAFVTALALVVFTFGFSSGAAAQSTDYTPSSVGAGNLSQGSGAVGAGNVANTGSNSTIPLTALGIGLVSVGGVVIALARRRRAAVAA